jgi:hypothetical protein
MLNKKDADFLKEIKEHFDKGVDKKDPTEIEYAQKMINDWVNEIEEYNKPLKKTIA